MSTYVAKAFNPVSKQIEDATYIDDYYGNHRYGIQFDDGLVHPQAQCGLDAVATSLEAKDKELAALKDTLREHHNWHLQAGAIGLQDGDGGWIEIDNAAEYSDSVMYERTERLLAGAPPQELQPMPRGGINTWWWEQAILLRRKVRAAEARAETQAKEIEALKEDNARLSRMLDVSVPLSSDGNSVFIDGAGDVEIDHGGKLRACAETAERRVAELEEDVTEIPQLLRRVERERDEAIAALKPFADAILLPKGQIVGLMREHVFAARAVIKQGEKT